MQREEHIQFAFLFLHVSSVSFDLFCTKTVFRFILLLVPCRNEGEPLCQNRSTCLLAPCRPGWCASVVGPGGSLQGWGQRCCWEWDSISLRPGSPVPKGSFLPIRRGGDCSRNGPGSCS